MVVEWIGINIRWEISAAKTFFGSFGLFRSLESSGYEQGLVMGTRLESWPSGNHVVEKYRVDGTLLSETPVQECTRYVNGWKK
jgi:hypothetical protein